MTTQMDDSKTDTVLTVPSIEVPKAAEAPAFGLKYRGYLDIPQDGIYSFTLPAIMGELLRIAARWKSPTGGNQPPLRTTGQEPPKKGNRKMPPNLFKATGL